MGWKSDQLPFSRMAGVGRTAQIDLLSERGRRRRDLICWLLRWYPPLLNTTQKKNHSGKYHQ
jgi:hypothetical protein